MNNGAKNAGRKVIIVLGLFVLGSGLLVAIFLGSADTVTWAYSPTDVLKGKVPINKVIHISGIVVVGSKKSLDNQRANKFILASRKDKIIVYYKGELPRYFEEDFWVFATGTLNKQGVFAATKIRASARKLNDYHYLGRVAERAGDYSKALLYYKKELEFRILRYSEGHGYTKQYKNSFDSVYSKIKREEK
ncbi:hypothetical protein MNBD_GAMMA12-1285 [hydrothermal vent metagenome]|uniref:Uncharacterized protein n=1 Tax=hydrothermal vent metagenome TaxID=652676 RepID=A0A3B0Y703_9ZZZZ